jgi:glucose-1-phosphate cytidylyltransferase
MNWYASWGHTDFILCLGYRGDRIREYFDNNGHASAPEAASGNGTPLTCETAHPSNWQITFVDTGLDAVVGERLKAIEHFVAGDETFLATYGDGLTDAPLEDMISTLQESGRTGLFISVHPRIDYHLVEAGEDGVVTSVRPLARGDVRINGGFFVFRQGIFDVLGSGEELVGEPFARLIEKQELLAYRYDGFWEPMDTLKDKQRLDALAQDDLPPWENARAGSNVRTLRATTEVEATASRGAQSGAAAAAQ